MKEKYKIKNELIQELKEIVNNSEDIEDFKRKIWEYIINIDETEIIEDHWISTEKWCNHHAEIVQCPYCKEMSIGRSDYCPHCGKLLIN